MFYNTYWGSCIAVISGSSYRKGVVSRAAQSSDGGSVGCAWHYTVQVDTQTQRDWSPPPDSTVYWYQDLLYHWHSTVEWSDMMCCQDHSPHCELQTDKLQDKLSNDRHWPMSVISVFEITLLIKIPQTRSMSVWFRLTCWCDSNISHLHVCTSYVLTSHHYIS